jgi:23S rRNA (pseudouridine1915-N3)-methyltransferase
MKLHIIAVGTRMPPWVADGFADYAGRMPRMARIALTEVKAEPRTTGKTVPQLMAAEAVRIEAALPQDAERVILDEHGRDFTTEQLARWIESRLGSGRDLAFVIGGPDGLCPSVKSAAQLQMRLSSMTLPHGMARLLLAEQLYRALSLLQGHPYHRE